jgi:hypothetical protein
MSHTASCSNRVAIEEMVPWTRDTFDGSTGLSHGVESLQSGERATLAKVGAGAGGALWTGPDLSDPGRCTQLYLTIGR